MHKFKLCAKCQTDKPPEGGISIGHKWHCQSCWVKQSIGRYTRNATPKTTRTP